MNLMAAANMHVKTTISTLYQLIGVWPLLFLHATR
jgi:hypothetical protein